MVNFSKATGESAQSNTVLKICVYLHSVLIRRKCEVNEEKARRKRKKKNSCLHREATCTHRSQRSARSKALKKVKGDKKVKNKEKIKQGARSKSQAAASRSQWNGPRCQLD